MARKELEREEKDDRKSPSVRLSRGVFKRFRLHVIGQIILIPAYCLAPALAQDQFSRAPYAAANQWMTVPVPWSPNTDRVPASLRQSRDQYLDGLIGVATALTPETAKGSGLSEGVTYGPQLEFPTMPNRSVVIATFVTYKPVLSRSGRSIYTEVTFSVSDVLQESGGEAPGTAIVVTLPGGTVITPTGEVMSFLTQPRQYYVKPGNTYLMVLQYHSDGKFYMLGKTWDLTSGIVQQNFSTPKNTRSKLIGLTVQELKSALAAQGLQ